MTVKRALDEDRTENTNSSHSEYASIREAGLEAPSRIPSHWELRRLKYAADLDPDSLSSKTEDSWSFHYVDIDSVDDRGRIRFGERVTFAEAPSRARRAISPGDVLFATVRPYLRAIALYRDNHRPAVASTGFCVARARRDMLPEFLWRYLQSEPFVQEAVRRSTGIGYPAVPSSELGRIPIVVPPKSEQNAICHFLRRTTGKIDRLIDKKKQLIELLEEKRTALITRAVTKGLDPDVPMKEAGLEWLGKIPEHWDLVSLRNLSPNITVGIVVKPTDHYVPEGVPCLRSQNVKTATISRDNLVFISEAANRELDKSQIYTGDLVTVRTGDPGTTAVVPEDLDGANCVDLIIIRKPELADQRWLCWFMNSKAANVQYRIWSGGAAQQHLNVGAVKQVRVPVPPADEQVAIREYIDKQSRHLKNVEEKLIQAIDRLNEYRSALITAAVTGKIDVRDHAA